MHCHTTQPHTHTHTPAYVHPHQHALLQDCGWLLLKTIYHSIMQRGHPNVNVAHSTAVTPLSSPFARWLPTTLLFTSPDMPALWLPTNTCTFCVEPLARLCALLGAYVKWKFSIFYKVKKRKQWTQRKNAVALQPELPYDNPTPPAPLSSFGLTGVWLSKNYVYVTWAGWLRFFV